MVNTTGIEELQTNVQYVGDVKIFSITGALVYQAGNEEVTLQNLNEKSWINLLSVCISHRDEKW